MRPSVKYLCVAGPGTSDIVEEGEQGLLVQNDPQNLAAGILKLINSPELMDTFRSNALKTSRAYDNKRLARKMLKVYEQAIQDKKEGLAVTVQDKAALVNAQEVAA